MEVDKFIFAKTCTKLGTLFLSIYAGSVRGSNRNRNLYYKTVCREGISMGEMMHGKIQKIL